MRSRDLLLASLTLVSALLSKQVLAEKDDFELRQLTDENFRASTASGLWLVEHFSPKCSHCRAFAPTWTQLAKDKQYLERLGGFHMAQVNCLAQGDLCNTNGIKFYPQLILYSDGKPLPHYSGDRSYNDLSKYIDEQTSGYLRTAGVEGQGEGDGTSSDTVSVRPNLDGLVKQVDEAGLEQLKQAGPVLTEFFAPWCGHCKKLKPSMSLPPQPNVAKFISPTLAYDELAAALQGALNIAAVDCEAHKAFCRRMDVPGYPTIRMFHHGEWTEYTGSRTLAKMKDFANKAVVGGARLQLIKLDDFDSIVDFNEAFFLYLQNFDTTVNDLNTVKAAIEPLLGSVPAYTSSDPALYKRLAVANPPPTSLLLAFSSKSSRPVGSLNFPCSSDDVDRFINLHRFPTLVELTSGNYQNIMKSSSKAIVVLGALHKGEEGEKEREKLAEVARAWKRGGRSFSQPVWFVWIEGEKWSGWLKQSYGIKKRNLPGVVVIDPSNDEYYDTTIEGLRVALEGASIFSVLEGFYQHFLRPKRIETALEWGSRNAAETLIILGEKSVDHPLIALLILVSAVGLFVFLLQKCQGRDPKDGSNGHHSHGGTRLD